MTSSLNGVQSQSPFPIAIVALRPLRLFRWAAPLRDTTLLWVHKKRGRGHKEVTVSQIGCLSPFTIGHSGCGGLFSCWSGYEKKITLAFTFTSATNIQTNQASGKHRGCQNTFFCGWYTNNVGFQAGKYSSATPGRLKQMALVGS